MLPRKSSYLVKMQTLKLSRAFHALALALGFALLALHEVSTDFDQSHARFDAVPKEHVKNARVDYAGLKAMQRLRDLGQSIWLDNNRVITDLADFNPKEAR